VLKLKLSLQRYFDLAAHPYFTVLKLIGTTKSLSAFLLPTVQVANEAYFGR